MKDKIARWDFIYVFQNPTQFNYRKALAIHISRELHRFLVEYAKKFAQVHFPTPGAEVTLVSAKQANRIGKAMFTHGQMPDWQINEQKRKNILKTRHVYAKNVHLPKIWSLQDFFLQGGKIQILGNTTGYYWGERFAGQGFGEYEVIRTTNRAEIATICSNALQHPKAPQLDASFYGP